MKITIANQKGLLINNNDLNHSAYNDQFHSNVGSFSPPPYLSSQRSAHSFPSVYACLHLRWSWCLLKISTLTASRFLSEAPVYHFQFPNDMVEIHQPDKLFCSKTKPIFFPSQCFFQILLVPGTVPAPAQTQEAALRWTTLQRGTIQQSAVTQTLPLYFHSYFPHLPPSLGLFPAASSLPFHRLLLALSSRKRLTPILPNSQINISKVIL